VEGREKIALKNEAVGRVFNEGFIAIVFISPYLDKKPIGTFEPDRRLSPNEMISQLY
jgi:hypothetical protein